MWEKLRSPVFKIFFVLILALAILVTCSSCTSLYPVGGAIIGGAAGSPLGPIGSAVGAGAGASGGIALQKNSELKSAQREIKALTTGDIDELVKIKLEEAKSGGFFDSILEDVYNVILLVTIGCAGFLFLPMLYTRFVHKKHNALKKNGDPGKG